MYKRQLFSQSGRIGGRIVAELILVGRVIHRRPLPIAGLIGAGLSAHLYRRTTTRGLPAAARPGALVVFVAGAAVTGTTSSAGATIAGAAAVAGALIATAGVILIAAVAAILVARILACLLYTSRCV